MVWGVVQLAQQCPFPKVTCANRVTDQILCKMRYSQETCGLVDGFSLPWNLPPPGFLGIFPPMERKRKEGQFRLITDFKPKGDQPQAIQKPAAKTTAKVVQQPVPVASLTPPITKEVLPARPDPYAGIPHQKQLPSTFQKALPDLTFSVHIFSSKPASRMVKINGQRLREGDPIAAGLTLKQITQDGGILSYKKRQFWINAR